MRQAEVMDGDVGRVASGCALWKGDCTLPGLGGDLESFGEVYDGDKQPLIDIFSINALLESTSCLGVSTGPQRTVAGTRWRPTSTGRRRGFRGASEKVKSSLRDIKRDLKSTTGSREASISTRGQLDHISLQKNTQMVEETLLRSFPELMEEECVFFPLTCGCNSHLKNVLFLKFRVFSSHLGVVCLITREGMAL